MKLSFSTLGCPEWSFDRVLEQAKAMGFDAIEVRGINNVMDAENIPEFSEEHAEATKARLRTLGLSIVGFGTSVRFHDLDAFDENVEAGKRAVDVCARMGIPYIRVFGDAIDKPENTALIAARVAKGIGMLCEYAHGKNVGILQEIHGNFNTIEAISGVIEGAKAYENFGILWDIEHSDKIYGDRWTDFYDVIRPYIRHTHFKDYTKDGDKITCCLMGEGQIPLQAIYDRLVADGYDGYFSFEWEKKWVPTLQEPEVAFPLYVRFMRALEA